MPSCANIKINLSHRPSHVRVEIGNKPAAMRKALIFSLRSSLIKTGVPVKKIMHPKARVHRRETAT